MEDETWVLVGGMFGLAIMVAGIVTFQRRLAVRLARQARVELPIYSTWRSMAVLLGSIAVSAIVMYLGAESSREWARVHAARFFLTCTTASAVFVVGSMLFARRVRRVGCLVLDSNGLALEYLGRRHNLDTKRPFGLFEAGSIGEGSIRMQVVLLSQDDVSWGFSYGLSLGKKPYGEQEVPWPLAPVLGAEARVLHDRLRAEPTMRSLRAPT